MFGIIVVVYLDKQLIIFHIFTGVIQHHDFQPFLIGAEILWVDLFVRLYVSLLDSDREPYDQNFYQLVLEQNLGCAIDVDLLLFLDHG